MRKFFWSRETELEPGAALNPGGPISLADRMAAGALSVWEALHYAIATAEALRMVHARGRAYGLLQPSGILIQDGRAQLVPAGLANITPYFSPEQVLGREIDPRSDIFSLGALLYEMLAGRKPFPAATKPALRFEIIDGVPAPLQNVPPAVAQLVMRCLEKKPERRMQRMEILLAALKLQEILALTGTGARGAS
jgi:eukaryotic-like serine/threonine-protein kinase